ncbi:hypothetical protein HOG48_02635 [Candidatus Peregrinibacteria bacterium]|jgi:hypothetical protein|nr:hypothetical protein [Candidatus Peregrinibacteria bacterium]
MVLDDRFFKSFNFSKESIEMMLESAEKNMLIAGYTDIPEVIFTFAYKAFIKTGIILIALRGYKARPIPGHHERIIEAIAVLLEDENVKKLGNEMREKRNFDLYAGVLLINSAESLNYLRFVKKTFEQVKQRF